MDEMNKTIAEPNADYKPNAPRIVTLTIDATKCASIFRNEDF